MPISASEIQYFKSSQGVGLGGAISAVQIVDAAVNNIFDDVDSSEALAGDTEHRCIYIKNTNATITLLNAILFLASNTTSIDTVVKIGLGTSGTNGIEQIIVDEETAAIGVTFLLAPDFVTGIVLGDIPANNGFIAVWVERVVTASASAVNSDSFDLTVQGETTA